MRGGTLSKPHWAWHTALESWAPRFWVPWGRYWNDVQHTSCCKESSELVKFCRSVVRDISREFGRRKGYKFPVWEEVKGLNWDMVEWYGNIAELYNKQWLLPWLWGQEIFGSHQGAPNREIWSSQSSRDRLSDRSIIICSQLAMELCCSTVWDPWSVVYMQAQIHTTTFFHEWCHLCVNCEQTQNSETGTVVPWSSSESSSTLIQEMYLVYMQV